MVNTLKTPGFNLYNSSYSDNFKKRADEGETLYIVLLSAKVCIPCGFQMEKLKVCRQLRGIQRTFISNSVFISLICPLLISWHTQFHLVYVTGDNVLKTGET